MNLEEIRKSGLIELYVMGLTDTAETQLIQDGLSQYKGLVNDLRSIENKLFSYARTTQVNPAPTTKSALFKTLKDSGRVKSNTNSSTSKPTKSGGSTWPWVLTAVATMIAGGILGYLINKQNTDVIIEDQKTQIVACDSLSTQQQEQLDLFQELKSSNNIINPMTATPQYAETKLYFHHNKQTQKNYIQIQNLPEITADQSFQLWALKGNDPPRPLDVFAGNTDIIEVQFITGTETYAITIEPKGGSESPTLENLIGTVGMQG